MKQYTVVIALAMTCWMGLLQPVTASTYLPVNHPVYDFLERMETRGVLPLSHLGIRPTTRTYAARLLSRVYAEKEQLSETDREELNHLLEEFRYDLPQDFLIEFSKIDSSPVSHLPDCMQFLYSNRQNLYSSVSEDVTLFFDPIFIWSTTRRDSNINPENNRINVAGNGFVLRGTVGEHVGFYVDVCDSKEWGSRTYNGIPKSPGIGWFAQKGDHAEYDETRAYLTYENGPFVISYGRGENIWGRAKSGSLALSDNSPPFDQFRFEASFWKLRFMYVLGEIKQYPQISKIVYAEQVDTNHFVASQKYITAHRIEINLCKNLSLGLYESVIFGDRFDFSYANPVTFLRGAEHYNRDHDNAAMGADFQYIFRTMSVYGEFFIDDITTKKIGTDWWGNKFAYQAGLFIVEPLGLPGIDHRVEYTKIKPWVYTHKYPINSYAHYGDAIGYFSGPNSDVLFVESRKRFSRRLEVKLVYTRYRHGRNYPDLNIGGDISLGQIGEGIISSYFLNGIKSETIDVSIGFSFEIIRNLLLKGDYMLEYNHDEITNIITCSLALNGTE